MTPKKIELVKKGRTPTHRHLLHIPVELYARMVQEQDMKKGDVTPFIIEAIKEKLEREKKQSPG